MATETDPTVPREPTEPTAHEKFTPLVSDGKFVRLGGAVAIITPFLFIGALIIGTDVANNTLDLFGHLLYIVVIVALYHLFRDGGAAMRLAVIMGVVGMLLVIINDFFALISVELVTEAGTADGATQSTLNTLDEVVLVLRSHLEAVGNALAWGVGGGLFSLAMLRTRRVPRWLGWGGVIFVVTMLLTPLEVMFVADGIREADLFFFGNMYGRLWLVVLGITLVRMDETLVP